MAALIENIRIGVLEELDRQKTQFFSTVSHELRTPLTLILGPMEGALAGRYGALPAGLQNDLATVLRNARRLLHLISQLLDFSRLESQKMQLQLKPIALHDFLLGILAAFEPFAERKHQRHSLQSSSDLPTLYADPEKLEKILYNLLSNACKFSPEGASITLRASHDDDHALISVSDTGIGIRADQLPHIFDRFYQADGSASREYEGTGIGLWLVKELVNLHGGTIHVESVYGKGATFTFTLPIQPTDTSIVAAVEPERMSLSHAQVELAELEIAALASETSLSTTHPHTLLIVEDNPDMRKFIGNVCDDHYNILTAKDGVDGLEQARAHRPQLIISDIMMPKMDGYQLCQAIRRDEDLKHIPLILLTAKADVEMKVEGLEGGADDYLIKPFNSQELLARIKNLIQLREQEAQLKLFNEQLEHRVQRQVEELERIGRLRRFLSPQLAEMIVSNQNEHILESHRREITVVFCDLRGFTAFAETTEPEDVMNVLREFHSAMGAIIFRHEGTLERFAGDGMMIFFNDPVPCPNPAERAVHMAVEMRATVEPLKANWRKRGFQLDLGVGISMGYATLGKIGFEQRFDYAAIGTVTNLASRLCDEAKGGQILISQRVFSAVGPRVKSEPLDELSLKGLSRPVAVYNVTALTSH